MHRSCRPLPSFVEFLQLRAQVRSWGQGPRPFSGKPFQVTLCLKHLRPHKDCFLTKKGDEHSAIKDGLWYCATRPRGAARRFGIHGSKRCEEQLPTYNMRKVISRYENVFWFKYSGIHSKRRESWIIVVQPLTVLNDPNHEPHTILHLNSALFHCSLVPFRCFLGKQWFETFQLRLSASLKIISRSQPRTTIYFLNPRTPINIPYICRYGSNGACVLVLS